MPVVSSSWLGVVMVSVGLLWPLEPVAAQSSRTNIGWSKSFATAESEAKRLGRPLLIHFYADWCTPCRRMDRDVLNSPELGVQLKRSFVGVKVNADNNPDVLERFGVRSLPADVVISPTGQVLVQTQGYQSKRNYVGRLARLGERFQAPPRSQTPPEVRSDTLPARTQTRIELEKPPFEPLPGLDGYSPVSLYTWREWRKGKAEFTASHQGISYQFVTKTELEEFQADPKKYVPKLLGCDPVILQNSDRAVPGSTKFAAYFDGALYLFQSPETRSEFKNAPMRYTKTRHVLKADDIGQGPIRQSAKPETPGDPIRQ